MKKIFTLFVAFLALTFCAKAQVTIILEAHDVWGDGSGYQLLLDANHNTYGTIIPETGPLTTSGDAPASVYAEFEYTVPVGADGSLTTTNMVYDGTATITIPAGTYDFCITNPTPGDRMWIASGNADPTRADDYVFVDGSTYHFLMVANSTTGNDECHLTVTMNPTSPMIIPSPASVDFGTLILGNTANSTVTVNNYLLTSDVTATTTAPFSISTDGVTFGTTATIPAAGGTLHVRYTPTAVGTDNGTITLSTPGVDNVTITLTGSALNCDNTPIPYSFSFDNEGVFECWTIVDANNDGKTFNYNNGNVYYIYNTSSAADDWLISPEFTLTGNEMGSFDYWVGISSFPERFEVYALGADTVLLVSPVDANNASTAPITQYFGLNTLIGSYRIGIHCISDADEYRLYISNFSIFTAGGAEITADPTSIDFGVHSAGDFANSSVDLTILNATDNITVSTAAPFTVSLDNTTYATSVTIPTPASSVLNQTIYVAYNPTAAGTHNGEITISTTGASETVTLTGSAIECSAITTLPFTETFDENSSTRVCWTIVDANNDDNTISYLPYDDNNTGVAAYFYSQSSSANDWLISPEIVLPAGGSFVSYDYAIASGSYPEKYSVWVIPQGGSYNNAINVLPTQTVTESGLLNNMVDLSNYSNQTIRVAIKVESDPDMYYIYFDNVTFSTITAPTVTITGPSSVIAGTPATFTANSPLATSFAWTVDGSAVSSTTNTMTHTFTTGGSHTVSVTASNEVGSSTASMTVIALSCDAITTFPYVENFENEATLDCWAFIDADGDGFNWDPSYLRDQTNDYGEGYGHNGSFGMIGSASWNNSMGALNPDNWFISPVISIPANFSTTTLSWYAKGQDPSYAAEHFAVYVSTTGANPSDFTTNLYEGETGGDWVQYTASLSEYAGQNIRIAFRHYNVSDMFYIDLDDITIDGVVGIDDPDMNISVYPNPVNNVLNINANCNINSVEVYNMMGQMVGTYDANDVKASINTTSFANGVYTVRINTENGTTTKKFTVAR